MTNPANARIKSPWGCLFYLIPVALILAGLALPLAPAIKRLMQPTYSLQFAVPGAVEVQLPRPGGYTIWHDYRTTFDGRIYRAGTNLPSGLQVTLRSKVNGENIPMQGAMGSHVTVGSSSRRSIGGFEVPQAGRYELDVSGPPMAPTVFSFRENWLLAVMGKTMAFTIVGLTAIVVGIILLVIIFVWRRRG